MADRQRILPVFDSQLRSVLLGKSGVSFVIRVTGAGAALLLQIALARVLGVEAFGHYTFTITTVNFLTLFCLLGLDVASLRFIPEYEGSRSPALLRGFLGSSLLLVMAVSSAVALACALAFGYGLDALDGGLRGALIAGCVLLPLNAVMVLRSAVLQSLKQIAHSLAPRMILRPVLIAVLFLGAVWLLEIDRSARNALLANALALAGVVVLLMLLSRDRLARTGASRVPEYRTAAWLRVSLPMMLIGGFQLVLTQADTLMLGLLRNTSDAGIYAVAARIASLMSFVLAAVNTIVAPLISQLYASRKIGELQGMLTLAARLIFAASAVAAAVIIVGRDLILGWFGAQFLAARSALLLLAAAQLVNALTGSVGYLMTLTGHQDRALAILGLSAVVNLTLNLVLIPLFGIMGAACATAFTTLMWNVLMYLSVRRRLRLDPTLFS